MSTSRLYLLFIPSLMLLLCLISNFILGSFTEAILPNRFPIIGNELGSGSLDFSTSKNSELQGLSSTYSSNPAKNSESSRFEIDIHKEVVHIYLFICICMSVILKLRRYCTYAYHYTYRYIVYNIPYLLHNMFPQKYREVVLGLQSQFDCPAF